MARAKNPKADEALALYRQGLKLIEIATELDVPVGTVRRWKHDYGWDSERSEKGKANVRKDKVREKSAKQVVESVVRKKELTPEQQEFCIYFVRSFNATSAYQKAYGCSYTSANAHAHRLLTKEKIRAEIDRLKKERLTRAFLREEDIFQRYMDIAFADITDYLEWGTEEVPVMSMTGPVMEKDPHTGQEVPLMKTVNTVRFKESADVDGTLIGEVRQGRDGASIKLPDRMKALEWLADHMNLATPEQKAKVDLLRARTKAVEGYNRTEEALERAREILEGIESVIE